MSKIIDFHEKSRILGVERGIQLTTAEKLGPGGIDFFFYF